MDRDRLAERLSAVGTRRTEAMEAKRQASEELAQLVPQAHAAGIPVAEIVRRTGLSRRGVYDFLEGK
jgi:DNA invertase Pin-like site-specific DNA recombinase